MKIPRSILALMAASAMGSCVTNTPPAETSVGSNTNAPLPVDTSQSAGAEDELGGEDETYVEEDGETFDEPELDRYDCPLCGMG